VVFFFAQNPKTKPISGVFGFARALSGVGRWLAMRPPANDREPTPANARGQSGTPAPPQGGPQGGGFRGAQPAIQRGHGVNRCNPTMPFMAANEPPATGRGRHGPCYAWGVPAGAGTSLLLPSAAARERASAASERSERGDDARSMHALRCSCRIGLHGPQRAASASASMPNQLPQPPQKHPQKHPPKCP